MKKRVLIVYWEGEALNSAQKNKIALTVSTSLRGRNSQVSIIETSTQELLEKTITKHEEKITEISEAEKAAMFLNKVVGFAVDITKTNLCDYRNELLKKVIKANKFEVDLIRVNLALLCNEKNPYILAKLVKYGFTTIVTESLEEILNVL